MRFVLFLSLPLYVLDQVTKWWALHKLQDVSPLPVIPDFFWLVFVTNTGAAFGSFKNNNWFFVGLSCIALVFVATLLLRRHPRDTLRDVSFALLLAGIMGNLTDRLMHGHVIDFLLFNLHVPFADPFPAFNVADSCICIAVGSFILHSLQQPKPAPASSSESV
ncbi:MAG: signal peptidase II [Chthoniobacterales bacterium]|nr:signal peptidase II [Chthoniobacterales bacterium]